jgi:hypothetical protein
MLGRLGYQVIAEGSVGSRPPTWKNRLRATLLHRVLGLDPQIFFGGGNYFVVADRITTE